MEITKVKINKLNNENQATIAMVRIVLDNLIYIDGLRIVNGRNGMFVSMPQVKSGDKYNNIVGSYDKEFNQYITDTVLKELESPSDLSSSAGEEDKPRTKSNYGNGAKSSNTGAFKKAYKPFAKSTGAASTKYAAKPSKDDDLFDDND